MKSKIAILVALSAVLATILLTASESTPLTWDEGDSFARADLIRQWLDLPTESKFSEESISKFWRHTIVLEGHPAGYSIVVATGKTIADAWNALAVAAGTTFEISDQNSYRFGPILLFVVALIAVFVRVEREFDRRAALFAVCAILSIPRLFVHSQIAACDSVLLSAWTLTWAVFPTVFQSIGGAVLWGICLGLTLAAKFSGWVAPIPFLLFALFLLFRKSNPLRDPAEFRRRLRLIGVRVLLIGVPTAILVFYLLNPPIWRRPISGFATFFSLNTTRADFNVPIYFLGKMYSPQRPLPWFNTLLWTVITVPPGILFFFLFALIRPLIPERRAPNLAASETTETVKTTEPIETGSTARNAEKSARNRKLSSPDSVAPWDESGAVLLLFLNFAALQIVRAFPGLPVHDGVRLFVPSFVFLGILAGIGAARFPNLTNERFRFSVRAAVACVWLIAFLNLVSIGPQRLAYYNVLIGGAVGAKKAGFESTYYWDALDSSVVDWLNSHTDVSADPPQKILFSSFSSLTLDYYRKFGMLTPECRTISARNLKIDDSFRWYVLQLRASGLTPIDLWLMKNASPVYVERFDDRPLAFSWLRYDRTEKSVPLLEIYSFDDFKKAVYACRSAKNPPLENNPRKNRSFD